MKILQTLYRFHNKENDSSCGLYCVELDSGNKHYFLQNDKSVGAITHYWGRPASNCVSIVKDNIKEKFFELLADQNYKEGKLAGIEEVESVAAEIERLNA